jgi:cytochrome c556
MRLASDRRIPLAALLLAAVFGAFLAGAAHSHPLPQFTDPPQLAAKAAAFTDLCSICRSTQPVPVPEVRPAPASPAPSAQIDDAGGRTAAETGVGSSKASRAPPL